MEALLLRILPEAVCSCRLLNKLGVRHGAIIGEQCSASPNGRLSDYYREGSVPMLPSQRYTQYKSGDKYLFYHRWFDRNLRKSHSSYSPGNRIVRYIYYAESGRNREGSTGPFRSCRAARGHHLPPEHQRLSIIGSALAFSVRK